MSFLRSQAKPAQYYFQSSESWTVKRKTKTEGGAVNCQNHSKVSDEALGQFLSFGNL